MRVKSGEKKTGNLTIRRIEMWQKYINATNVDEVLKKLAVYGEKARVIAGGTDLVLEFRKGARKDIELLIDVSRIDELAKVIIDEDDWIHIGAMITHNQCVVSKLVRERGYPLALASWQVGAPQIRNRGTIAGNIITGSPANDTITPLMAMDAIVVLRSLHGERNIPLKDFYKGVRKTVMNPDEMLVEIKFPAMKNTQHGVFMKLGLRRSQAISVVNAALVLDVEDSGEKMLVKKASITLGAVAPTIIHACDAEKMLAGQYLTEETIMDAARLAMENAKPISDVRGSAEYRREMVRVLVSRGLRMIRDGKETDALPGNPVLLWKDKEKGKVPVLGEASVHDENEVIETKINGQTYRFEGCQDKTLLRLLREDAGLPGTKEGCDEGECGACTVFLDGMAVMSCLVPAPRAHHAEIVTIEGIGDDKRLSHVQDAFVHEGAVQCGYCIPGFVMSAEMLLTEVKQPSRDEIKQAITGNICRCTGYYKIVNAIEKAAQEQSNG